MEFHMIMHEQSYLIWEQNNSDIVKMANFIAWNVNFMFTVNDNVIREYRFNLVKH